MRSQHRSLHIKLKSEVKRGWLNYQKSCRFRGETHAWNPARRHRNQFLAWRERVEDGASDDLAFGEPTAPLLWRLWDVNSAHKVFTKSREDRRRCRKCWGTSQYRLIFLPARSQLLREASVALSKTTTLVDGALNGSLEVPRRTLHRFLELSCIFPQLRMRSLPERISCICRSDHA